MKKSGILALLFFSMMKIGLFTFGGGIVMLALLENELVSKRQWIDKEEFLDMAAIAESTPGPIAINSATYIGFKMAGFWGALLSTVAVCIPSFVIIYIISLFLSSFLSLSYVTYAFQGIRVAVVFLILQAGVKLFRGVKKTPLSIGIILLTTAAMLLCTLFAVSFSAVFYILIGGVIGIFAFLLSRLYDRRKEEE